MSEEMVEAIVVSNTYYYGGNPVVTGAKGDEVKVPKSVFERAKKLGSLKVKPSPSDKKPKD